MATYTMELKDVIESIFNDSDDPLDYEQEYSSFTFNGVTYGKLPVVPDYSQLGLGTYPIFNEQYRPILNGKIIDEYFTREIGVETIDMFQLTMRRKMDQIMPYYNQLYASLEIEYEALQTMDIHSVGSTSTDGTENSTAKTTTVTETDSKSRAVTSNTPQTMLSGNGDYATNGADSKSDSDVIGEGETESNATNNVESATDSRVTGFQGNPARLVMEYRASLINVDMMILNDIIDCFMLVLGNADDYTLNGWYQL